MKKRFSYRSAQTVLLYLCTFVTIPILWLLSPSKELATFTLKHPETWVSCLVLSLIAAWKYVFLRAYEDNRKAVWIFPVLSVIFPFIWWTEVLFQDPIRSGTWIPPFWYNPPGAELFFIYAYYCPILLSSCVSGWIVSPSRLGKLVFSSVIALLSAACIYISVFNKNNNYRFVLVLLVLKVIILAIIYSWSYFPRKTNHAESETDIAKTNY